MMPAKRLGGNLPGPRSTAKDLGAPKNGKYWVALMVGGHGNTARKLDDRLRGYRIHAKHHWDYEHSRDFLRPVPIDVDLAFILVSALGHQDEGNARNSLARAGVPYIRCTHKWSAITHAMHNRGHKFSLKVNWLTDAEIAHVEPKEETPTMIQLVQPPPPEPVVTPPPPAPAPEQPVVLSPATVSSRLGRAAKGEAMVLAAQLQEFCASIGISVMVTPDEITVSVPRERRQ